MRWIFSRVLGQCAWRSGVAMQISVLTFGRLSLIVAPEWRARKPPLPTRRRQASLCDTERLGPLPLVNHFIERIGLDDTLARHVASDARCAVPHARALGVLLRSIIVEREPIYRQQETVHGFASGMFGISAEEMNHLSDDRLGRALDHLFDADRTALLTEVVLAVAQRFGVNFDEFHNDTTTISFCGSYRGAIRPQDPRTHRTGDHLWIFARTTARSEAAAVHPHHEPPTATFPSRFAAPTATRATRAPTSRRGIRYAAVAGRSDFLYVADSKLCSRENMDHIDRAGGRFVTVMPRSRLEDAEFRQWIQTNTPEWTCVWDRPNPRHSDGPRDCWYVYRAPLLSMEAWSIVWVWSHAAHAAPGGAPRCEHRRRRSSSSSSYARGWPGSKTRLRGAAEIDLQIKDDSREAPRRPLSEGPSHRARRTRVQANAPRSPRPRHCLPQDHQAAL